MSLLTADTVKRLLKECLLQSDEEEQITPIIDKIVEAGVTKNVIADITRRLQAASDAGETPFSIIPVHGIIHNYVFRKDRLEARRDEIFQLLEELPDQFRASSGGGWSFLNMCEDRHGNHWAEHITIEGLIVLGAGLKLMSFLPPQRELWKVFPGGMPYLVFHDKTPVPVEVPVNESIDVPVRDD